MSQRLKKIIYVSDARSKNCQTLQNFFKNFLTSVFIKSGFLNKCYGIYFKSAMRRITLKGCKKQNFFKLKKLRLKM